MKSRPFRFFGSVRTSLTQILTASLILHASVNTWADGSTNVLSIAANSATKAEGDSGNTSFTFTVSRSGDFNEVAASWAVTGSGGNPADASDFGGTLASGSVNIGVESSSETITVSVSGDTSFESDEEFTITLTSSQSDVTISQATATGTIQNDDTGIAIAATDADKDEGDSGTSAFTFTVTRSGVTTGTNTVNYSINGSGSNPASSADVSGSFPLTGTVTFNAGETSQTISVNVRGNTTVEPDEEFTVTLSNASNSADLTTATATGVIRNDDSQIRITRPHGGTVEGDSGTNAITFSILREGATPAATMDYTVSGTGNQAADATDFGGAFPSGTLSWATGETNLTLTIYNSGDTTVESNEVFQVVLSNASDGARFDQSTVKMAILDDDAASDGDPLVAEHFTSFTTLSGNTPLSGPADTGVGFEIQDYEAGATTTSTGFARDTAYAVDGRGLHFEDAENTALYNRTNLNDAGFTARSHMVAFWFRFTDNSASGINKRTQLIGVTEQVEPDASFPFYQVELGTDGSGQLGAGVYGTQPDESFDPIGFEALAANTWHQCVIQYSAPSLGASGDAGMQVWFNPASGGTSADIDLAPSADQLVSFVSNGSVGRMAFGSMFNESTVGGPDVYIDCVGIWDGFGVSGRSDLASAIAFLNGCTNVTPSDPNITWSNPADIAFGTTLSATQLNATADVTGTFAYSPVSGTLLNAGSGQTLSAIFTPFNTGAYNSITQSVTINVSKVDPTITWGNPAAIGFGTALSSTQLNATASVTGTFSYSPASGTILDAGNGQELVAMFTPDDTVNYNSVSATNTIDVAKATPNVTWSDPADIVFGTALSGTQLDAVADVGGTFAYSPAAGTVLNAGDGQTLQVVFTPTDSTNYESVTNSVTINVGKANPSLTWYSINAITFGTALSTNQLNAMANVAGSFTYTPTSGTVLQAGSNQVLTADFTPTDATNYNPASVTNSIDVAKATPSITWTNPVDIVYGTALSVTELNATSDVPGTFAYTPALGTLLLAGQGQTLSVTFTPDFPAGYEAVSATVSINVAKADPTVTWPDPAPIVFGAALGTNELNAIADVTGSFSYDPIARTILAAGSNQTLGVSFTPDDNTNFNNVTASASIDVLRATPLLTWSNPSDIVVGTLLSATQLNASANVAGSFAYDPAAGTNLPAGNSQVLSVTFTPDNTNNYENAMTAVVINVLKADPTITWTNPASITAGTALSGTQLNASANVAGTFAYVPAAGTVLAVGDDQPLSVVFTPTDIATYNSATGMVTIDVTAGTPTITWTNPVDIVFGTVLSGTQLNATADVPGTFSYSPISGTLLDAGNNQTLSVQFTPTDTASYSVATATVSINVSKADPIITWNPVSPVAPGTALGTDQLNASANISGSFSYSPGSGTAINTDTTVTATFAPTDTNNYNSASTMATIAVQSAGAIIDNLANAALMGRVLGPNSALAQPFMVNTQAFTFTDLTVRLSREIAQNGTVVVALHSHDAMANGPGPILESWPPVNVTGVQVPAYQDFMLVSTSSIAFPPSAKFWVVVRHAGGGPINWSSTSDPMNAGSGMVEPAAFNPDLGQMGPFDQINPIEFLKLIVNGAATVITPPTFNITPNDANKAEGNTGSTSFTFTITRGGDVNAPMAAVGWNVMGTGPNPATADDFEAGGVFPGGVVSFTPGQTTTNIAIAVRGDTDPEPNEEFLVTLADPQFGAQLGMAGALGTIQNDDGVTQLDFGDAPDVSTGTGAGDYQTLLSDNGPSHVAIGPKLGALRDAETDGNQSAMADGDDTTGSDDEDGVLLPPQFHLGQTQPIHVIVSAAPVGAKLNAWIDWNADGIWSPTEQIAADLSVVDGTNSLNVATPTNAAPGTTYARFRLDTVGGRSPVGAAPDGEVEDYEITVAAPASLAIMQTGGSTAVVEGGTGDSFDVRLVGMPTANVTVTVTPTGNDISLGAGAATPAVLTFTPANAGSPQTVNVSAIDDALVESPETENVTFATTSSDNAFNNLMHPPVVVTIADNDMVAEPTLSITALTNARPEGNGGFTSFIVRVSRTGDTNSSVSVQWQTTGTGASPAMPDDFNAAGSFPGGIVSLIPGQLSVDVPISVVADYDPEPDEGFTVTLSNPVAAQLGTATTSLTILNDDAFEFGDAPLPFPTVLTNNGARHHASGPVLGLERDADMDGQPNPNAEGDDVADGSDDEDGVRPLGPLVPGQIANLEILVSAAPLGAHLDAWIDWNNNNNWNDPGEQIAVSHAVMDGTNSIAIIVPTNAALQNVHARFRLSGLGGLAVDGSAPDGEVEDHRFQVVPPATFTIAPDMANQPEGDSATTSFTFTINRTGDLNAPMASVSWAVHGSGPNPADGADFDFGGVLPGGGFSFAPGQASTNLTISVLGDTMAEPDEGFVVVLTNTAFGAIIGSPNSAPGLIVNDDTNVVTEYSLDGFLLTTRAETDDPLTQTNLFHFTVSRTGDPNAPAVIAWNVSGTGANPANPDDFDFGGVFPGGVVNFNPGQLSSNISVRVLGDVFIEPDEQFLVSLAAPQLGGTLSSQSNVVATIENDDFGPTFISIIAPPDQAEGDTGTNTFDFVIQRAGDTNGMITAFFDVLGAPPNPVDNQDGLIGSGLFFNLAPGVSTLTLSVPIFGDTVPEPDEFLQVHLHTIFGAQATVTNAVARVINDDVEYDFGDLLFLTTLAQNGARHAATGPRLGELRDPEPNGQPSAGADGDDLNGGDDEDGVRVIGPMIVGQAALLEIVVTSTNDARLHAWIDWNNNSNWNDPGEQIVINHPMINGTNTLSVNIPTNAVPGGVAARFRLASAGLTPSGIIAPTLSYEGPAADGEVEDYVFQITPPGEFNIEPIDAVRPETDDPLTQTNLFVFRITRGGNINAPMAAVSWAVSGSGPAPAAPDDFNFGGVFPAGSVNFAPGQTHTNIAIGVRGDTMIETNESFAVTLSNPAFGATIGNNHTALGLIQNDDLAPSFVTVTVTTPSILEGNTGTTNLEFVISRSGNTNTSVGGTMIFRGGPTNPVDSTDLPPGIGLFPVGGGFSFSPGETNVTLAFPILGDTTPEPNETVELAITSVADAQLLNSNAVATVINDDYHFDFGDLPFLTTLAQNGARHAAIGPRLGEVRDHEPDGQPSVIAEGDDTFDGIDDEDGVRPLTPLLAGQGADFEIVVTSTNGARLHAWIDWNNNSNWNDAGEHIAADVPMMNGTNILSVLVPTNASPSGNYARFRLVSATLAPASVALPTLSYDGPAADGEVEDYRFVLNQPPTFDISPLLIDRAEGDSNTVTYTFTITRSGELSVPMASAQWRVEPVTLSLDGNDFDFGGVLPGGTFNFAPGQTTTNITILVRGDLAPEPDERFRVVLSNPAFGAVIGANHTAEGVIRNDDTAPAFLSIIPPDRAEGDAGQTDFVFQIVRTGNTNLHVAAGIAFRNGTTNPVDSLDTDLVIFTAGGLVNLPPGVTNAPVVVTINGDTTPEPDETFEMYFQNLSEHVVLLNTNAFAVIRNDDLALLPDLQVRLLGFNNEDARIEISGPPNRNVVLEASADLILWQQVNTGTIPGNQPLILTESGARQLPARFYRAREAIAP